MLESIPSGIRVFRHSIFQSEQFMANVIQFDEAQRRAAHVARLEQQRHEVEEAGNHAWGRLQKARKFNLNDRREIAKAMHEELEDWKLRRPKLSMGDLAKAAGLPNSKELYRLTLPPGEDPIKRGLRADAKKYVRLLKAIQRNTGENMAQLVDRLTWATSFHPKQNPGTEESERMMNYLQEVINCIDREFKEVSGGYSLFEIFMETARIKVDMAKQGGRLRWPYYDFDNKYADVFSTQNDADKDDEILIDFGNGHGPEYVKLIHPGSYPDFIPLREDDFDTQYAYWKRDYENPYYRLHGKSFFYPSGVAHHDALMSLPRIYLGLVGDEVASGEEDDAQTNGDFIQIEEAPSYRQRGIENLKSHVGELSEIRDPETGHAHIAHRHLKTGEWIKGLSGKYGRKYYWADESYHIWLVIYPSPDNTTLLPVLYRPMEEGGTLLTPLKQRSLISLREMLFVDAGEPRSLYDRIKELMRASSDRAIYKAWQETAKDVLSNPILRAHKDNLAKKDDFERGVAAPWDDK